MPTGAQPLRNGARVPRNMAPGAALASLQTNSQALRNVRYSYTETPTEFQRPTFEQFSPADSMIEESPISPRDGYRQNLAEQAMKAHIPLLTASTPQAGTPYYFPPPQEVHPAHFAPYADPAPLTREPHQFQQPQSPGPLPIKLDQEPASPSVANIHNDEPEERKANSPRVAPPTEQKPLVYNPDSLAGPNVTHGTHRPGQVSHPNAAVEPDWKHGLCEVDMLCCTGIVCPCMVYGKTQYRLSRKAQKQEPTDLLGYESCNSSCVVMAVACGFQGEHHRRSTVVGY